MPMSKEEAEAAAAVFELHAEDIRWLQAGPYCGSLGQTVPTDPPIYQFYEIVQVLLRDRPGLRDDAQGARFEEEFGDAIMSAIDFTMDIRREPDPKADRAVATFNGKFLPYKKY